MKKVISILLLSLVINISAKVWEAKPGLQWDPYWENKFSQWIKDEVRGDFFKKLGGPYVELPLDCADAAYGLRIYFSAKHQLPWNSGAAPWSKYKTEFSNEMTNWDHLETQDEKIAQLILFLLDRVGTESLANLDTYSVALADVRAGDLFMYKYCKNGSCTRHTYIIKDVNSDGTFYVIYGTQLRAKKKRALGEIKKEYLYHKPDLYNWGFKRFKINLDTYNSVSRILEKNDEQYEVAKRLTEEQFFDYVNVSVRVHKESATKKLVRLTSSLCHSLSARTIVVDDAIEWQSTNEFGNQCMNEATYDAFSTPSRDTGIYKQYQQLKKFYYSLDSSVKVSGWIKSITENIFNPRRSNSAHKSLNKYCSIPVSDGVRTHRVNLGTFYDQLSQNLISYHPNDNIFWRWGVQVGARTNCHVWYGSDLDEIIGRTSANDRRKRQGFNN